MRVECDHNEDYLCNFCRGCFVHAHTLLPRADGEPVRWRCSNGVIVTATAHGQFLESSHVLSS